MAKLYWRVKIDGKWTWRPLKLETEFDKQLVHRWHKLEWNRMIQEWEEE